MTSDQMTTQAYAIEPGKSVLLVLVLCWMLPLNVTAQDQGGPPDVPSNWTVEEVAKYPEIKYPSVVEVAPDGRVFVGEDPMDMLGPADKPIDRVVCFHPDGRKTVVAEDLYAVYGLLYLDGKLYVHHPPRLSVFDLEDGKGVNRRVLIETVHPNPWVGTNLNDHIPAQIRLAMDGYIYMSVGDKGIYGAEGTDGSTAQLQGGGVLRFRPDGSDLEVYTTGTRNHLDIAVNARGDIFSYDNDGGANIYETRVMHLVDGGYYGYPYEVNPTPPYVLPKIESYGGGSPTGAVAYTGARLPKRFHGNLFMLEWGKQAVIRYVVSRTGATYRIDRRKRFFSRNQNQFKPVGIAQGQDGISFYVTDWNFSGWHADKKRGQLFKMTFTGDTRDVSIPEWYVQAGKGGPVGISMKKLIGEGLKHPAKRVRMVAQRRLTDRGKQAIQPIVRLLKSRKAPEHAKWHGIWTLDAIDSGRSTRNLIMELTGESHHESVRRQAIRQLGTRRVKRARETLVNYLEDDNATIRFRAATALGRIGDPRAVPPMLEALDEEDRFVRYAVFNGLNRIGRASPESWEDIAEGLKSSNEDIRSGSRFAMRETYLVENVKALSNLVLNGTSPETRSTALRILVPLLKKRPPWEGEWWGTSPADEQPRPKTETWEGTSIVRATLNKVVKSGSPDLKSSILEQLAKLAPRSIPSSLVPRLMNLYEKQDTRSAARKVLLKVRDKRALSVYLDGLASDSEKIRERSSQALRSISSGVREQVFQKVRQSSLADDVVKQLALIYSQPEPVRKWHLIGPFERNRSRPFDLQKISTDASYDGKNDTVSWTQTEGNKKHGLVNMEAVLGNTNHAAAFARTVLKVEQEMNTQLILGSDDGLKVWVNGKQVFKDLGTRGWAPDQFRIPVTLEKGENEIVCRIEDEKGGWRFSVKYIPSVPQEFRNRLNGE